jgi:hypothetical protein
MKKLTIFAIMLLVLTVAVSAANFDIKTEVVVDNINIDQQAKFLLTITNNRLDDQDYSLSFGDVGLWELYYTEPLGDYFSGINGVDGKSEYTTKVILKPIAEIGVGFHNVVLKVKEDSSGVEKQVVLPVYIKPLNPTDKEYLPHVTTNVDVPDEIDPRNDNSVRIILLNKNRKDLTDVDVRLESNLIKKTLHTKIEPLGKSILTVPLELDPLHPPTTDTLYVTVTVDQYTFKPDPVKLKIIDYSGEFKLSEEVVKGFLITTTKRVYTNDGNVAQSEQLKEETSLLGDIFASSSRGPDSVVKEGGKRYRVWNLDLAPGEEYELELYVSYRPFFYFLLLIVLGYYVYVKFKSPIVITKEAKNVEMREGGISEVKILLNIKNTSSVPMERITVIDKIPNIANITPDYDVGTIKPTKVKQHAHKGSTIVQWDIEELDAHENRLVIYRVKSKLSILGKFSLPLAMIKFHTKSGKQHKVFSNRLVIGK